MFFVRNLMSRQEKWASIYNLSNKEALEIGEELPEELRFRN